MLLKDRVAIITGGGQGIGREIALTLSKEGADIVIVDLNLESADQVGEEIKKRGREAFPLKVDVANSEEVGEMVKEVLDKFKKIDILVNNAGITRDSLLLRMKEEDWDDVLGVNLKGVFLCTQRVAAQMLKQKKGKIVNIASIIGMVGNIGQANYSASKGGVIALTKTMAKELAPRNINVNAVAPGFITTVMTERIPGKIKEKFLDLIPLNRWGSPQEVAELVLFLVSEKSNYITGQVIRIDGGMVM
jgi:3-oxoacyl-[acyl-carrier protein] reductase